MSSELQIGFALAAYLLGSIPVGYLGVMATTGQDIRKMGSGNIGSTNVKRIAGKRVAAITQLLDMAKGLLPVALYLWMVYDANLSYAANVGAHPFILVVALASILGHDFSLFLKLKGGKGVNTTLGASVLLAPIPVCMAVATYFFTKWRSTYVSAGSIVLSVTLVVGELLLSGVTPTFYYFVACMVLIVVLHRKNIERLLHNEELSA
ncbi:MAG: glycerol-3-phosphate 1-O-acyltransferase PlsY [Phocaeicola sp.]